MNIMIVFICVYVSIILLISRNLGLSPHNENRALIYVNEVKLGF